MAVVKEPEGIKKIKRSDLLTTFINTTPDGTQETWALLGVGVTEYGVAYNPQVEQEQWIIHDNANNDHTSNQKQGDVTQKCYLGDPVFEYIASCRDKLNCKTQVLDIDTYNKSTDGGYPAKKQNVTITVSNWAGENAECEYNIYYDGDPIEGSVTITGGKPTFTEKA